MFDASLLLTSSVSDRSTSGSATSHARRRDSEPWPFDVCHVDVLEELVDFQSQRFLVVAETAVVSRPMIVEDILGDVARC